MHHSGSTSFTPLLPLQRVWDERGDPLILYRDECNCFRGYHVRPSLGAAQAEQIRRAKRVACVYIQDSPRNSYMYS